jgi:hypothetical protein
MLQLGRTSRHWFSWWPFHKIGHRLPERAKGRPNSHDQKGSKKHGSPFAGCDDSFYGLGLLVKYDSKEAGPKQLALKTEELEVRSQESESSEQSA